MRIPSGTVLILMAAMTATTVLADVVTMIGGRTYDGRVISVDDSSVVVLADGRRLKLDRAEVARIDFTEQAPPPPLKVEIRNIMADDSITVLLEDEVVIEDSRTGGSWVDLTQKLKNGNNALRFLIRNDRGAWSYRLSIRINGKAHSISCGQPPRYDGACKEFGHSGYEEGEIDDLPVVWIFVDRELGEAEIIR